MSQQDSFLEVGEITLPKYKKLIMELVNADLKKFVKPEWIESVYNDDKYKNYIIRTTVNLFEIRAREQEELSKIIRLTGYAIPGSDVISLKGGGAAKVIGQRITFLTDEKPVPNLYAVTSYGQHVNIISELEKQEKDRIRVDMVFFRKITILCKQSEWKDKKTGELRDGLELFALETVHSTDPIDVKLLNVLLMKNKKKVTLGELNRSFLYHPIVLTNIKWRSAIPLDEWVDSTEEFDTIQVKNPDGSFKHIENTVSGRKEILTQKIAKKVKSPDGQPFIQKKKGTGEDSQEMVWTLRLMIDDITKSVEGMGVVINFDNYVYAAPEVWLAGWEKTTERASERGDMSSPDPRSDPFSELNNCYRSEHLTAVVHVIRYNESTNRQGIKMAYITLAPGFMMYKDITALPEKFRTPPPFPLDIPDIMIEKKGKTPVVKPVEKTTTVEPDVDPRVEEEAAYNMNDYHEQFPEETETSYKAKLEKRKYGDLQKELKSLRDNSGYQSINLQLNKTGLIEQLIGIWKKEILPNQEHMDAVPKKEVDSDSKAKLIPDTKEQIQAGTTDDLAEDERIEELKVDIKELLPSFPELSYTELVNLEALPDWVTDDHRSIVEGIITKAKKELGIK